MKSMEKIGLDMRVAALVSPTLLSLGFLFFSQDLRMMISSFCLTEKFGVIRFHGVSFLLQTIGCLIS